MMEEYERSLRRSEAGQKRFRVQVCVTGMVTAFRQRASSLGLWKDYPGFEKAVSLVRTLNRDVAKMGGISRIRKENGRIDLGIYFDDKEWKDLVEMLSRLNI